MGRPSTARKRLLTAASREFTARGAQAVGVDELCRLAGINKGSFYHFYPSKTDLLLDCLHASWEDIRAEVLEPAFAPDLSPRAQIRAYFDLSVNQQKQWHLESNRFGGCIFANLGNELSHLEPSIQACIAGYIARNLTYLSVALKRLEPINATPEDLAEAIYTLRVGAMVQVRIRQNLVLLAIAREAALALLRA